MERKHKYRFKTEEEFINDYGQNWRQLTDMTSFITDMDYLLGTDIDESNFESIEGNNRFRIYVGEKTFGIIHQMWKKVDKVILPNYKPRTFIKD